MWLGFVTILTGNSYLCYFVVGWDIYLVFTPGSRHTSVYYAQLHGHLDRSRSVLLLILSNLFMPMPLTAGIEIYSVSADQSKNEAPK